MYKYKYLNNIYNVYYTQNDCIIFSDNSHQCDIFLNEFDIICKIVLKVTLIIFLMKLKTQAIFKKISVLVLQNAIKFEIFMLR